MKKLVLLLALALVGQASAVSMYLTVDGQDVTSFTATIGQTYTIGIWSNDLSVVPEPTALTGSGMYGNFSLVTPDTTWGLGDTWGSVSNPVMNANMGSGALGWANAAPSSNIGHNGWDYANPTPAAAGLWAEWTFTPKLAGDGSLYLLTWGEGYASTDFWDSVAVTNVPEPATLALLGLGGLFLRRKR